MGEKIGAPIKDYFKFYETIFGLQSKKQTRLTFTRNPADIFKCSRI